MEAQITQPPRSEISLRGYTNELDGAGTRVFPWGKETFWAAYEFGALMRIPSFHVGPPAKGEVQQVLQDARLAVATYLLDPDESHPGNCWLYVCSDPSYGLEKLSSTMRRNVRRGLKELQIRPVTLEELLSHGAKAFCDTRRRVGLSDGTPKHFRERVLQRAKSKGHVFLGAWKDQKLAAFLSIAEVDDWVEIEGCFSCNSLLNFRPNDTLFFSALSQYLTERQCRIVSYGVSSIQEESNSETLHVFKTKVGFEARRVHRVFELHPFLRPFQTGMTLRLARMLLWLRPGNRLLKKIVGVLNNLVSEKRLV